MRNAEREGMKKVLSYLITTVIISAVLAGCGSSSDYKSAEAPVAATEEYYSDDMYEADYISGAMCEEAVEEAAEDSGVENIDDGEIENSSRKIIRNVNISAETEDFDSFISNVDKRVKELGGYMESTNISGRSISSSSKNMRSADLVARVPSNKLDSFVSNVADISNITNKSESAEDITLNYADTQAHISSLRTEQQRLNELLLEAEDIETIIAIESRITDVRYELESYESRLRTMDNKVDYSTVSIYVKEVERYTPVEEEKQTVWQRIAVGFTENLLDAKDLVIDFIVGFIISIPILVVLAIFIGIPVVIIFFVVRFLVEKFKGPEYRAQAKAKRAEKKAKRKEARANKNKKVKTDNGTKPNAQQ